MLSAQHDQRQSIVYAIKHETIKHKVVENKVMAYRAEVFISQPLFHGRNLDVSAFIQTERKRKGQHDSTTRERRDWKRHTI